MSKEFAIEFRTLFPRYGYHSIVAEDKKDAIRQAKELLRQERLDTVFNLEAGAEDPVGGIYISCDEEGMEFDIHIKK